VSTKDKRLTAIRANPRQVRFADLQSALEGLGFIARTGSGDHWTFTHPLLSYHVTVDPRRPHVLPVYVKQALRAIDEVLEKIEGGGD
jgi:hypothetical protein